MWVTNGDKWLFERVGGDGSGGAAAAPSTILCAGPIFRSRGPADEPRAAGESPQRLRVVRSCVRSLTAA